MDNHAQQVAKGDHHVGYVVGLADHGHPADGVERVEQEMRAHLHLQRFQLKPDGLVALVLKALEQVVDMPAHSLKILTDDADVIIGGLRNGNGKIPLVHLLNGLV